MCWEVADPKHPPTALQLVEFLAAYLPDDEVLLSPLLAGGSKYSGCAMFSAVGFAHIVKDMAAGRPLTFPANNDLLAGIDPTALRSLLKAVILSLDSFPAIFDCTGTHPLTGEAYPREIRRGSGSFPSQARADLWRAFEAGDSKVLTTYCYPPIVGFLLGWPPVAWVRPLRQLSLITFLTMALHSNLPDSFLFRITYDHDHTKKLTQLMKRRPLKE